MGYLHLTWFAQRRPTRAERADSCSSYHRKTAEPLDLLLIPEAQWNSTGFFTFIASIFMAKAASAAVSDRQYQLIYPPSGKWTRPHGFNGLKSWQEKHTFILGKIWYMAGLCVPLQSLVEVWSDHRCRIGHVCGRLVRDSVNTFLHDLIIFIGAI